MSSFNQVILIGRLGQDPEMRYTTSGKAIASFSLAVERRRSGEGQAETDWISVSAWERLAELCSEYLRKGSLAHVSGRLQVRKYDDKDGNKRTAYEVVANDVQFLTPKDSNGGQAAARPPAARQQPQPTNRGNYQGGGGRQQSGRQDTYGGGYQDNLGMDDVPF